MQEEIISKIEDADITIPDWEDDIIKSISDKYAKGYLSAKISILLESFSSDDEGFREALLDNCEYDIWNK